MHVGKNEEKVEGGGMKVDDATAAFAAWLRQLPAHLVNFVEVTNHHGTYHQRILILG